MTQQTAQNMDTTFQTSQCKIIPYVEYNGMRTFTDTFIMDIYDRMDKEGMTKIVFSDGEITGAKEFLSLMKYGANALYIVEVYGDIAGIVWLNRFKGRTCYVHFCSFQKYWGEGSVKIGQSAIGQVLDMKNENGEYRLDTLLGLIPCSNIPAIKWLKKVGLREVGTIPWSLWNQSADESEYGLLLYLTRECLSQDEL